VTGSRQRQTRPRWDEAALAEATFDQFVEKLK
jgi:hypothetical protein